MKHVGKSVRLYMVEGTPHGILTAEIVNWTGHIVSSPREKLPELLSRGELKKSGVYFLVGQEEDNGDGKVKVYIGQSENVGNRLVQHSKNKDKDFWEKTVVVTSKDQNLTSGHIKYLESRLCAIAKAYTGITLYNGTDPSLSALPEADVADMEYFVSQLRLVLPLLGLEFLREAVTVGKPSVNAEIDVEGKRSPIFVIESSKHKLKATGQEIDGEFVVFAGSQCRARWEGNLNSYYKPIYEGLYEQGLIQIDRNNNRGELIKDVRFSSPSGASAIVYGRSSNGRTAWKTQDGKKTYEDWQNTKLLETVHE